MISTKQGASRTNNLAVRLLLSCCVLSASIYFVSTRKAYYESQLVCVYHNGEKAMYGELANKLDELARSGSTSALATELHVQSGIASKVLRIISTDEQGKPLYKPSEPKVVAPIYFSVRTTSRTIFPALQGAIVTYLNEKSPFTEANKKAEITQINERLNYLSHNLNTIDSIIGHYVNITAHTNIFRDTSVSNLTAIYAYKSNLEERILDQKRRLAQMGDNVEVLDGFVPPEYPIDNRRRIAIFSLVAVGLIWVFPRQTLSRVTGYARKGAHRSAKIASELLTP